MIIRSCKHTAVCQFEYILKEIVLLLEQALSEKVEDLIIMLYSVIMDECGEHCVTGT